MYACTHTNNTCIHITRHSAPLVNSCLGSALVASVHTYIYGSYTLDKPTPGKGWQLVAPAADKSKGSVPHHRLSVHSLLVITVGIGIASTCAAQAFQETMQQLRVRPYPRRDAAQLEVRRVHAASVVPVCREDPLDHPSLCHKRRIAWVGQRRARRAGVVLEGCRGAEYANCEPGGEMASRAAQ